MKKSRNMLLSSDKRARNGERTKQSKSRSKSSLRIQGGTTSCSFRWRCLWAVTRTYEL